MDNHLLQNSKWRAFQKYILPNGQNVSQRGLQSRLQNKNGRNFNEGFFTIEMLIWISIILLILVGYFSISKVYITEHRELQKEYKDEWNKLDAKRRN